MLYPFSSRPLALCYLAHLILQNPFFASIFPFTLFNTDLTAQTYRLSQVNMQAMKAHEGSKAFFGNIAKKKHTEISIPCSTLYTLGGFPGSPPRKLQNSESEVPRLTTISTAIYTLFINKQRKNLICSTWEDEMPVKQLTLSAINAFDQARFSAELASLFEGPPWIVNEAWHARPFTSLEQLHQALCKVMYNAPIEQQEALLLAHPDLVGRAALAGTLSPASTSEQASAGLDRLSPEEIATFTRLNQAYHERFGFPFIICVRANKKESILAGFNSRLHHSRRQEIEIALGEVAKICAFRLRDLVLA